MAANRSRVTRKSSGSSSTSRTRTGSGSMLASDGARGEGNYLEPEGAQGAHDLDEGVERDRLLNVAVGPQVVATVNIFLGLGSRQDDHRDAAQVGVAFDFAQRFPPALAGHIKVQKDHVRARRGCRGAVRAAPVQVVHQ